VLTHHFDLRCTLESPGEST